MSEHNVVVACMASGAYGTISAVIVADGMSLAKDKKDGNYAKALC